MSPSLIWGPYPVYQDIARLEYSRILWKSPHHREALRARWLHPSHPHRQRFLHHQSLIDYVLSSKLPEEQLDRELRARGTSLRAVTREIPHPFPS